VAGAALAVAVVAEGASSALSTADCGTSYWPICPSIRSRNRSA
jgi:hypothetical protein